MNTTVNTAAVASFSPIEGVGMRKMNGDNAYYAVTPAKGARIVGDAGVSTSSHTVKGYTASGMRDEGVDYPSAWIEFGGSVVDADNRTTYDGGTAAKHPFTVNGRDYDGLMFNVDWFPADEAGNRVGTPHVLNGVPGVLIARFSYSGLTDAARDVVGATGEAIAAEFITAERWHTLRVRRAEDAAEDAAREAAKAAGKHAAALETLAAVKADAPTR